MDWILFVTKKVVEGYPHRAVVDICPKACPAFRDGILGKQGISNR